MMHKNKKSAVHYTCIRQMLQIFKVNRPMTALAILQMNVQIVKRVTLPMPIPVTVKMLMNALMEFTAVQHFQTVIIQSDLIYVNAGLDLFKKTRLTTHIIPIQMS